MLWSRLRRRDPNMPPWGRQHAKGPYILDFCCPAAGLAVEIDGSTHGEDAQIAHDARRDAWLLGQGVTVYRVSASSVFTDVTEVADGAKRLADELVARRKVGAAPDLAPSTTPPSVGQGRQD